MKERKNLPLTPHSDNPNILEFVSESGAMKVQYVASYDHYRYARSCSNGNWIVLPGAYAGKPTTKVLSFLK